MSSYTTVDKLTPEVLALMDRAVRAARERNWCSSFEEIASEVFLVPEEDIRDSDGRNCEGFDRDGYNEEGYDDYGFNREGYNEYGLDRDGFDREGFNRYGLNKDGFDREGRDKFRFDENGWDREGYNSNGNRRAANREWYAKQSDRPETDFRYDNYGYSRRT